MSAGGNQSTQTNQSSGSSWIAPEQVGSLQSLWAQAMGAASPGAAAGASATATGMAMPGIRAGLDASADLAANGSRGLTDAMGGARALMLGKPPGMTDAVGRYGAADRTLAGLSDTTAMINAEDAALRSGLDRTFRNTVMPSIRGGAVGAGGFGGGRQGVAEGVAAGELGAEYRAGRGDIVSRARTQATQAAGLRGQLAGGLGQLGLGERGVRLQGADLLGRQGGQQAGIRGTAAGQTVGMGQTLQEMLVNGANSGLSPLMLLGQILGNPAILSGQESSGRGMSEGFTFGWGS